MYNTDHRPVLKELGVKNAVQLIYLLFILNDILAEHDTSMKNYIDETFQKQVAQFEATEMANDTPVSVQVQPMETEIFENVEHQSMDVAKRYLCSYFIPCETGRSK
ncbi:unnamed protein product [Rhizophagus irregularis]|nr:unnamed protein product [Rhizophagus irregularis]